jgi:hypothetical protein
MAARLRYARITCEVFATPTPSPTPMSCFPPHAVELHIKDWRAKSPIGRQSWEAALDRSADGRRDGVLGYLSSLSPGSPSEDADLSPSL